MAFFKERVGLNSRRPLEGFNVGPCISRVASVDGEVGRLLPGFFVSLSRRMSRQRPSASGVSSLDEEDDAKDKLDDDDVAD